MTTVTRQQYFTAVSQLGSMDTLYQNLTINTNDPAWIEFWAASNVTLNDALSQATQTAFGWSSAQMVTLFNTAAGIPAPTPAYGFGYYDPTFASTYQGLCNKIADTLNRQDLTQAIPDFTVMATNRISRDMARIKHPSAITRAQASVSNDYASLPSDFLSIYQLMDQDAQYAMVYITPDQSMTIQSQGWNPDYTIQPIIPPFYSPTGTITYYTIMGNTIRIVPAPSSGGTPLALDLWYYAQLPALTSTSTTNWALTKYPDLYLYGALTHTAPYLKNDDRITLWDGIYNRILGDIEVEADRATRPQSKLVAARRSF